MGRQPSKELLGLGLFGPLPDNVIDFSKYLRERFPLLSRNILFICNENENTCPFSSIPVLRIEQIHSLSDLFAVLKRSPPELIFVESSLSWEDPLHIITEVHHITEVPIVMVCKSSPQQMSSLLKQAYAAGLSDVLKSPVLRDDLMEILSVFLQVELQHFKNH